MYYWRTSISEIPSLVSFPPFFTPHLVKKQATLSLIDFSCQCPCRAIKSDIVLIQIDACVETAGTQGAGKKI